MLSAAKTLWKHWVRLPRNYILKTVVKISRVLLNRFCLNWQGLCKKVLYSEPEEFFWKKMSFSFYFQKADEKWAQIFRKKFYTYAEKRSPEKWPPEKCPQEIVLRQKNARKFKQLFYSYRLILLHTQKYVWSSPHDHTCTKL